jgi:hypothetical protein
MNTKIFFLIGIFFILIVLSFIFLGKKEGFTTSTTSNETTNETTPSNYTSLTTPNYDNYDHYSGTSYQSILYAPNGSSLKINTTSSTSGTTIDSLTITSTNGTTTTYTLTSSNTYKDSSGNTAVIVNNSDGTIKVVVTTSTGEVTTYSASIPTTDLSSMTTTSSNSNTLENVTFYGPNGGTAEMVYSNGVAVLKVKYSNGNTSTYYVNTNTGTTGSGQTYKDNYGNTATVVYVNGQPTIVITGIDGTTTTFYINQNYTPTYSQSTSYPTIYGGTAYGPYGGSVSNYQTSSGASAGQITGPGGNSVGYVKGPNDNVEVGTNYDSTGYYNSSTSYSPGIPGYMIPPGSEDLYILKSQVVPPVCPKCPPPIINKCDTGKKCPPCPACQRCPDPPLKCELVPNYESAEVNRYLPQPVLADFSTFGL